MAGRRIGSASTRAQVLRDVLGYSRERIEELAKAGAIGAGVMPRRANRLTRRPMLFMVIEKFRDQNALAVYREFRAKGRQMPDGLTFVGKLGDRGRRPLLSAHGV